MNTIRKIDIQALIKQKIDQYTQVLTESDHTFHIPVLGLAFTVDSPAKVARFGISSVVSIVEDRLAEMMRAYYYPKLDLPYEPITKQEPDYRAKRITDYLNLLQATVYDQASKLKTEAFKIGTEITKYFEMLPDDSNLKMMYLDMIQCPDLSLRAEKEALLRDQIVVGAIDVNILTKVDGDTYDKEGHVIVDGSNAVTALRGYIQSNLRNSSVCLSAGMNPRLYGYLEDKKDFYPDEHLHFDKRVIIKVSDYRSALIQGKFLAKKGVWISEFRIESGLNCGGHAFATKGYLLGPVLEEFKQHRGELIQEMFDLYQPVIAKKTGLDLNKAPKVLVSVQGGICSHEEDVFLRKEYNLASTGWGSPFLLVPEATTVDDDSLQLLAKATEKDVHLSGFSPMGVPFYYLNGTSADKNRRALIAEGNPGSPCPEKLMRLNTELTERPICTASKEYQSLKLKDLQSQGLSAEEYEEKKAEVLGKDCLCLGLCNAAALKYNMPFVKNFKMVSVCPGPNIANFSEIVSLQKMVDHIYGRTNLVTNNKRSHLFIAEMKIYIEYLRDEIKKGKGDFNLPKRKAYYKTYISNMLDAVAYYRSLVVSSLISYRGFSEELSLASDEIKQISQRFQLG
ncbi:MAG: hypothetical protein WCR36_00875 [Bacteroidaceae bacterium]